MINSNGWLEWGPGGSLDQDILLERSGVDQLTLRDTFAVAKPAPDDTQPRIALKHDGGGIHFGPGGNNPPDVFLSRFEGGSPATKGLKLAGGDFYVSDAGKGIILKSASGNCFRLKVNDDGTITQPLEPVTPCP